MIVESVLTLVSSLIWLSSFILSIFIFHHLKDKPPGNQTLLDLTRLDTLLIFTCIFFNIFLILLISLWSKDSNEITLKFVAATYYLLRTLGLASILVNFIIKSLLAFKPGYLDEINDSVVVYWSRISTFILVILALFCNFATVNSTDNPLMKLMSKGKYSER